MKERGEERRPEYFFEIIVDAYTYDEEMRGQAQGQLAIAP